MELRLQNGTDCHDLARPHWWSHWREPPELAAILYERCTAVAALRLFPLCAVLGDERFDAVGIGGVWVPRDQRGRGLGSTLMEHTVAAFKAKLEVDFLALYSRERTLYKRVGFKQVGYRPTPEDKPLEWLWLAPIRQAAVPSGDWKLYPEWHF